MIPKYLRLPIIFVIALICSVTSFGTIREWNSRRGYDGWHYARTNGIFICNHSDSLLSDTLPFDIKSSSFRLTFRASVGSNSPTYRGNSRSKSPGSADIVKMPAWSLCIIYPGEHERRDTISLDMQTEDIISDLLSDQYMRISIRKSGEIVVDTTVSSGIDVFKDCNSFSLHADNGMLYLRGGNRDYRPLIAAAIPEANPNKITFSAAPGCELLISDISFSTPEAQISSASLYSEEEITAAIGTSRDPIVGYWTLFDRMIDEKYIRKGGDYSLAIIPDGSDYLILYLDGASKNKTLWRPFMVKGKLRHTPFPDIFDAIWLDASMTVVPTEIKANFEGNLLTLIFPYYDSKIRFAKTLR